MARKKAQQQITIDDLIKLGPKKLLLLVAAAIAAYFFGGQGFFQEQDNSGFIVGTVTRVVDGDTAVINVDGQDRRVRLLGVDTPETVHPKKPVQYYGKEASNFTKKELTGKTVWLQTDVSPLDRYNRMLAYVWLEEPSKADLEDEDAIKAKMYNAKLLLEGYAQVMTIQPNSRYSEIFVRFQGEARENNKGLWGEEVQ